MNNFHIVPACLPYTVEDLEHFIVMWQSQAPRIHIDCVRNISPDIQNTLSLLEIIQVLSPYEFSFKYIEFHVMGDMLFKNECSNIYSEFHNAIIFSKQDEEGIAKELHHPFGIEKEISDVNCMMIEHIGVQGQSFKEEYVADLVKFIKSTTIKNIHIDGGINSETIKMMKEMFHQEEISDKEIFFTIGSYLQQDSLKRFKEIML